MELVEIPENPLPEGIRAGTLATADGIKLRYAICTENGPCRGTVCIFQGRGEFIEKYFETVRDLRRRGYSVALFDWRGQGGSDRPFRNRLKGHISSFREYDLDLTAFMLEVALPDCPPPYFALAHSTGATVLLRALGTRTWFTRVVASAPLLGLGQSPARSRLIGLGCRAAVATGLSWASIPGRRGPSLRAEDVESNPLTSDRDRYLRSCKVLEAAPWLAVGLPTFGWVRAAAGAMGGLARMPPAQAPRAPILMVGAGDDHVVSTEASRRFGRRVPGVAVVVIERARHEILMERDEIREQFWAAFDSFMSDEESRLPEPQTSASRAFASS